MAYVVRARDTLTEEIVACKIPLDESEMRAQALRRQYQLFRNLKSRNLQALFAFERHRGTAREFDFLVFEFVAGQNLEKWHPGTSLRRRLEVLATIAETLAALATEGAVHGDLGLPNVVVDQSQRVVLIDPEPDEYGSSVSRTNPGARTLDLSGLRWIAEELLPAGRDRDVVRGLLHRMSLPDVRSLTANEVGGAIRHVLSLPFLPGESEMLGAVATAYTKKVTDDRATFAKIVDLRDLAFRNVCDLLKRIVAPLGIHVDETLDGPIRPTTSTLVLQAEVRSIELGRGQLHHRSIVCTSTHGDTLGIYINPETEIRKPWPFPERPGLISRGTLNVVRDGKQVFKHDLEIWIRNEAPVILVVEPGRYRPFDASVLERATLVLIEQLLPGLEAPVVVEKTSRPWFSLRLNFMNNVKGWCERRKTKVPKVDDEWHKVFLEMVFSVDVRFPVMTSIAPLRRFFELPLGSAARLTLVREAVNAFRQAYGQDFSPLYCVDVSVVDEIDGRLRVVFEGGALKHSFEVDVATTAMIVARIRNNPKPVAGRRGNRRRRKGSAGER